MNRLAPGESFSLKWVELRSDPETSNSLSRYFNWLIYRSTQDLPGLFNIDRGV